MRRDLMLAMLTVLVESDRGPVPESLALRPLGDPRRPRDEDLSPEDLEQRRQAREKAAQEHERLTRAYQRRRDEDGFVWALERVAWDVQRYLKAQGTRAERELAEERARCREVCASRPDQRQRTKARKARRRRKTGRR